MKWITCCAATLVLAVVLATSPRAQDPLLDEAVEFTAVVLWLETGVPGLLVGVVRDGETSVAGFGEFRDGAQTAPDGDTPMRIGSITKAFTGQVLASLVVDGTVNLTDPVAAHLDWDVTMPTRDGHAIRLIDLVTHTSGLPREIDYEHGPDDNPFAPLTPEAYIRNLEADPLLFAPGTGSLYSNFGFDVLAQALAASAGQSYDALLRERVLQPIGLTATGYALTPGQQELAMQGHGLDGEPLPDVPTAPMIVGSGGLYTTANDMLRWLDWHLDRYAVEGAEVRLLDHAAYVSRDGLDVVYGMDESGLMDAMGLGWVVMYPEGDRPLILQKAGGLQGIFVYAAFAPNHGIGVFAAINTFDFGATVEVNAAMNALIGQLAPR